jgi:hypothetical protein
MEPTQKCIAKIGEPYSMKECGSPCVYRTDLEYEGWYHHPDPRAFGHHAVPASLVR